MTQLIAVFLERISAYNLLNYFLPGALFCLILKFILGFDILVENDFWNLLICYFCGLIIGRIGSVIIEPVLKKVHFLKRAPYEMFLKAVAEDKTGKVQLLSNVNNSFRSYTVVFFVVFIVKLIILFDFKNGELIFRCDWATFAFFALLLLFLVSYRKQTNYVRQRVEIIIKEKDGESK